MGNKILFCVVYLLCAVLLITPGMLPASSRPPMPAGQSGIDTAEQTSGAQGESLPVDIEWQSEPTTQQVPIPPEPTVSVYLSAEGIADEMTWEEYLTCVLMAEVPHTFHEEALKAQAVAARTYCLYRVRYGDTHADTDAGICTDHTHCMAYLSKEDAKARWGEENASQIYDLIFAAVKATAGEYLEWEGKPIAAVFHSSSAGKTENAEDVWGSPYPYLISVDSPEEQDVRQVSVPLTELNQTLKTRGTPDYSSSLWSEKNKVSLSFTESGRVKTFAMNGYSIKGTALRSALGLRSTSFDVEIKEEAAVFTVRGYGHGVGMSQHGADAMAKQGADYKEILAHYYQGAELVSQSVQEAEA